MNWGAITMFILAASGAVSLLLTQAANVLAKASDVARAWREFRNTLKSR